MDISEALVSAKKNENGWMESRLLSAIVLTLRRIERAWLSWDEESGEQWAKIMLSDVVVAFININLPFIMIQSGEVFKSIRSEFEKSCSIVLFTNADRKEFSVSTETFEEVFSDNQWRMAICEPDSFSAQELYFMTAS